MGFRNPITTATATDTGAPSGAGVSMYQSTAGGIGHGAVEWRSGFTGEAPASAVLSEASSGSGGRSFAITGGSYQGVTAPELELNVESSPTGGYVPAARITGAPLTVDGLAGLAAARLIATGNAPVSGTYGAGVWTSIPWGAAPIDTHSGFSAPGSTRWTVPAGQGGPYLAAGQVVFTGDGANPIRNARIVVNGATVAGGGGQNAPLGTAAGAAAMTGAKALTLNAGDIVELQGLSSNAWATTTFPDSCSNLQLIRIR